MHCPKCNRELKDGYLYCEHCGYEIQMVPDFEPDVDGSILSSLREIQKEAFEEEQKEEDAKQLQKEQIKWSYRMKKFRKEHKMAFYLLMTFCVSFCVLLLAGGIWLFRYLSPEVQYDKAMEAYSQEEYGKSLSYVEHTLMLQPEYSDAYIAGFQCSMKMNAYNDAERFLLEGIKYNAYDETEITYCFDELIKCYMQKQQYSKISKVLLLCPSSIIVTKYQEYLALPVSFSYAEGNYIGTIPLKLSSGSEGTIYYTFDDVMPDTSSKKYTAPIFLEEGEYTINALFINEYGVASEVVTKKYIIEERVIPLPPSVNCYSGEYVIPEWITIDSEDKCSVYYTTDGTIPTEESLKYSGPIPMPLGKTQFKFVCYNEDSGYFSDVITREYEFELNTDYEYTQAQRDLYALMINEKIILDYAGTRSNYVGSNSYDFQYVITEEGLGEFYLFAEFFDPEDGTDVNATGNMFAVGAYDGVIYRVTIDENMDYVLSAY
ncbi:MAG: chitobiase/beta-hexosaminidase C-terminal domain-containing protein [Lachnospiraceae bacterium]|nr:chitobiase/beta-hexosaminidase C-terminal domain-containing protein [Lachnospiraceae bacterium]